MQLRKTIASKNYYLFFFITLLLFADSLHAQGDLLIFPKRVVMEGNKRYEQLNITNIGADTQRYQISFVQYRMNEDGTFSRITAPDAGQQFADTFLRFFPRSVTLGPRESQVIKVELVHASTLQPGEYRSHIFFRAVPADNHKEDQQAQGISIRLQPIFGISIPALIRVGNSTAQGSLTDLSVKIKGDSSYCSVILRRMGNMSLYGNLSFEYISPQGKTTMVTRMQGLAIYTPNTLRRVKAKLPSIPGVNYKQGKLRVIYTDDSSKNTEKLAEAVIDL